VYRIYLCVIQILSWINNHHSLMATRPLTNVISEILTVLLCALMCSGMWHLVSGYWQSDEPTTCLPGRIVCYILSYTEDGGSRFLQNVSNNLPCYKASHTKIQQSSLIKRVCKLQLKYNHKNRLSAHLDWINLMFIGLCIIIYTYSKTNKMHLFLQLFILVKHSTCFGRSFRPSSGTQDCTHSNRHMSNSCCYLLLEGMLAAGSSGNASSSCLTYACCCMCSLELLMMDGKTVRNM
jgi:hypothetical protein